MVILVSILAQGQALDDFQKALRDQIRHGGSVDVFVTTLVALIVFGIVAYAVAEWRRRARLEPTRTDPHRLYLRLLDRLKLTREQREWLLHVAEAAKLKHPATLLLAESLFDQHAALPGTLGASPTPAGASPTPPTPTAPTPSGPPKQAGSVGQRSAGKATASLTKGDLVTLRRRLFLASGR